MPFRNSFSRVGLVAFCLLCAAPTGAVAAPFSPQSFWTTPLSASAPVDAGSAGYVADLNRQVKWGTYINTTQYGVPVYTVTADQPLVRVSVDRTDSAAAALQTAFDAVPIPPGAKQAAGKDAHLVISQPSSDRMWEFWHMRLAADGWHAGWGGAMSSTSTNKGAFGNPLIVPWWSDSRRNWGATATGLPLLGGLMRTSELASGRIDHAIAIGVTQARYKYYTWPAQRTDGQSTQASAVLEGMRFRLPAGLDIAALHLPPTTAAIARAVQRYGMVIRDRASGGVVLYAEDPAQSGSNPYPGLFEPYTGASILDMFPWSKLVTLQTNVDRTPPTTTITSGPAALSTSTSATFTFTADDPNVKIQCGLDGSSEPRCPSPHTYEQLAEGPHSFWAQAIDRAGLYRPSVHYDFVVDTVAPVASVASGPDPVESSSAAAFTLVSGESGATLECQLDTTAWRPCAAAAGFDDLDDGRHSLRVRATDAAGNIGPASPAYAWTVATEPSPG